MLRFCLLCCLIPLFVQGQSVEEIRKVYTTASTTKEHTAQFYQLMQGVSTSTPLLQAYKGAALMMYAKQSGKLRQSLKEGKALIEGAIEKEPENIELRMVRLSVQEHLPKIVPYRSEIKEDKAFIQNHIAEQPQPLKKYIENYINNAN